MIGRIYGRLTILRLSHLDSRHRKFYVCSCSCGGEKIVQGGLLLSHNTKSCGCMAREQRARQALKRLPNDHSSMTAIILGYRRGARDRGIEWHLTRAEVDAIVRQPCHYCGAEASNLKRTKNCKEGFPHNGIDRVDSSQSYRAENVVPCCRTCNVAKGTMSHDGFIAWAKRISRQWGGLVDE